MNNYKIHENKLTVNDFYNLQYRVGFGKPNLLQSAKALDNSLYIVSVSVDDNVVGMGRLVGDAARIYYIQDVCIDPNFQGKGIGKMIVEKLLKYVQKNSIANTRVTVGLMSARDNEGFYEKLGFRSRPNDREGCGMVMKVQC